MSHDSLQDGIQRMHLGARERGEARLTQMRARSAQLAGVLSEERDSTRALEATMGRQRCHTRLHVQ